MAVYIITGKLGSGKSLFSISAAWRYLKQGRRVVSNYAIDFSSRPDSPPMAFVEVVPDLPNSDDLKALGRGGDNEHTSGVLIIDEAARWLNSRDFADKDRKAVIDWLLHSRKLGWDVYLLIQHIESLDKQVRNGLAEMHVICRRLDRVKFFGFRLPQIHFATVYYGIHNGGNVTPPKVESFTYRPAEWGQYYDTQALFSESRNSYCLLSRWHLVTRYLPPEPAFAEKLLQLLGVFLFGVAYFMSAFSSETRAYLQRQSLPVLSV